MKQCTKCNELKAADTDNFYKNKRTKDGLTVWCKDCLKEYQRQHNEQNKEYYSEYKKEWHLMNKEKNNKRDINWHKNNKERSKELYKNWIKNNPDKVREYSYKHMNKIHDITEIEWKNCKVYFNYCCAYCGMTEEEARQEYNKGLHKEHAINEGENDLSNCIPSCTGCNSTKHTNDYMAWFTIDNPIFDKDKLEKINQWLNEDYKLYIRKELLETS